MQRSSTLVSLLVLSILAVAVASSCTRSSPALDKMTLQLNWFHEAEFVGYYVADAKGFYAEEGLDVAILEGGPDIQARDQVLNGKADLAICTFAEQRDLVAQGKPAVAVFSVFQIPPLVMFALSDSGISEPRDMVGRRVGIKNDYWRDIARQTLSNAGVDPAKVIEVPVDADAKYLLYQRKVDVWMGYAHDEPIEAQVTGHEVTTIYPADYGVGGYEGLVLVNQTTLNGEPSRVERVERFVRATQRGWLYAVEHPDEAAAIMTAWQPKDTLEFQKLAVRALIPLVDIPQAPVGWIDTERWRQLMGPAYDDARPGYTMRFVQTDH